MKYDYSKGRKIKDTTANLNSAFPVIPENGIMIHVNRGRSSILSCLA